MAKITPMIEALMDSTKPVEELKAVIVTMANGHPGQQLEIFKQLEMWLGEVITNIEKQQKPPEPKEGAANG